MLQYSIEIMLLCLLVFRVSCKESIMDEQLLMISSCNLALMQPLISLKQYESKKGKCDINEIQ